MQAQTVKIAFPRQTPEGFYATLKERANNYFKENNISTHANASMVIKTIVLLSFYFGAYALILSGRFSLTQDWLLCVAMGIGTAGLGFSVAHDAIHEAYSSNKQVNFVLGLVMNIIGGNRYVWSITHNVVHHTYTNVSHIDEDLEVAPFLRLSKHVEHKPIHRIQHLIGFAAYAFSSFFWVFIKDYKKFFAKDLGPYKNKKHPASELAMLIIFKVVYYTYLIAIPLLVLDIKLWQFAVGFLTMHITAGLILGIIFQLAHVVEGPDTVLPDKAGNMEDEWAVHQLKTTSNFATDNPLLTWYCGGLNHQVEHHLFPRICSVHYTALSKIVKETAAEFNIPYYNQPTFAGAVGSHYRMLKKLSRP